MEDLELMAKELALMPVADNASENFKRLCKKIDELIAEDFNQLVQVLYRMDVSEYKLRTVLKEKEGNDAAEMIAGLMIARQAEKIKSRRENSQRDNTMSDEERW